MDRGRKDSDYELARPPETHAALGVFASLTSRGALFSACLLLLASNILFIYLYVATLRNNQALVQRYSFEQERSQDLEKTNKELSRSFSDFRKWAESQFDRLKTPK